MQNSYAKRALMWIALLTLSAVMVACATTSLPIPQIQSGKDDTTSAATPAAEEADAETAAAVDAEQATVDGIPVGFTEDGYPYRGNPDAPITIYEYSDYECPFCARHVIQTEPALKENFLANGDVRIIFRDFPLEGLHPNAIPAAVAANCVGDQGIVPYWEMHTLLFRTQSEWSNMNDPAPTFARLAEEAGADPDLYATCLSETGAAKEEAVRFSVAEAGTFGFTGTPSFLFVDEATTDAYPLVGAQPFDVFASYITAMQAGEAPVDPAATAQEEPQIPYWATTEGLAPTQTHPASTWPVTSGVAAQTPR
ncbi:MAG: thioredoxin domain-containing protein [Caldilineaceae bacterium]